MARKKKEDKKKEKKGYGWDEEDRDEALEAEGLKRGQMDVGRAELVDRDTSTPYIETYDEDTGELEGSILLKNGNREGMLAIVRIVEKVDVKQDHEANLESLGFSGKLNVENPSAKDRLWDIDITLKNIESTNLKSADISIQELGTSDDTNIDSREFEISGEAKSLLLVKEYINTLPDADNILNINDIETDLMKLKDKTAKAEKLAEEEEEEEEDEEEEEEEEDEEDDAGTEEYSLESFGISIDKENTVTFAIAMVSLFEKPIRNVKVVKNIFPEFSNTRIEDTTIGNAELEGDQLIWTIDVLEPQYTVICKFTSQITVNDIQARKTGIIDVSYEAASSFAEGLGIDKFDAYTTNRFYVDIIERDEEPNVWDCKLVFENSSEFLVQLFNADVYAPDAESTKLVDIDPNDVPVLPAGAEFHSVKWQYESEDYPQFRKLLEFRVMPDFVTQVNGTIAISDVELAIASITGEVFYTLTDTAEPTIKEIEEMLIQVPTFKETPVIAVHKLENNGSAPLNEVVVQQEFFTEEFQAPNADEVKVLWDGSEIELDSSAVYLDGNSLRIELKDLKDSSTGMLEPESKLEVQYPIHCINPAQESRFESEVIYLANTYPLSNELEVRPVVPAIEAIHIRRKFRVGKEVLAIGDLGNYKIILILENIGDQPLKNLVLLDKVPDNFEYGEYSMQPEITDEVGTDTLKWEIEELAEAEKLEISYEIHGKGEYSPSDAQLAY
ncbi:MAG: hypothetical protein EU532_12465 [Promethearchaeota archaeon]|nr:MAG: hypothetical protein EU532_12465 [Candidatus Lokiarchaeota archaeon]